MSTYGECAEFFRSLPGCVVETYDDVASSQYLEGEPLVKVMTVRFTHGYTDNYLLIEADPTSDEVVMVGAELA